MTPSFEVLQQHDNYARMIRRLGGRVERVNGLLIVRRFGLGWTSYVEDSSGYSRGFGRTFQRSHSVLDLTPSIAELRRGLAQKWRNRLNASVCSGLVVRSEDFSGDPAHWLLEKNRKNEQVMGFRSWPVTMTCTFAQNRGTARLYVASMGNHAVAAILVFLHGNSATYHIGWRDDTQALAHNLLIWSAICDMKAHGIRHFDMGLLPQSAPGLNHFKLGTGAKPTRITTRIGWIPAYSPSIHSPSGQKAWNAKANITSCGKSLPAASLTRTEPTSRLIENSM